MNPRRLLALLLMQFSLFGQAANAPDSVPASEAVLFDSPPVVETASLYTQTIKEAPASVTLITQQQIRTYGYRTLAEVLSNVRGFYATTDSVYQYVGVRGFGLPGDYNSRILVMLNGHYLTDNVYGAMYMFGQDFGLDLDLVQRIEIVRGPSSAIYGSNGVFATINIFTRAPADTPGTSLRTDVGSFGQQKMFASTSAYLGRGANLLLAASGFRSSGRTMTVPEPGDATTDSVGAERGYHTFAQLTWYDWSITANFNDRTSPVPIGFYGADFGDTGTNTRDAHNFVEAALTRPAGRDAELRWRLYYDQFHYQGRYIGTADGVRSEYLDAARGDWVGTQVSYRRTLGRLSGLTLGAQTNIDFRNTQSTDRVSADRERIVSINEKNSTYGVFSQYERTLGKRWVLLGGVRIDDTRHDAVSLSPRLSLVWQPRANTAYKLLSGRAFRNPSTFERYYEPNPQLAAERISTVEFAREQRIGRRMELSTGVFQYRMTGLIEGVPVSAVALQYRNGSPARALGGHIEATGQTTEWLEWNASITAQRSRGENDRHFPNSPARIIQFRAAAPVYRNRLTLSSAVRSMSSRETESGTRLEPVTLADVTATTKRLHPSFDVQFGVRNLFNHQYADPLNAKHLLSVLPSAGRTFFFRVMWHYGD